MIRDRFNTNVQNLCPALRWKGQFVLSEPDPTVPRSNDGLFCEQDNDPHRRIVSRDCDYP